MSIIIRNMELSDLPAVMQIEQDVYPDPWQEEMFYQEIKLGTSYVLEDTKKLLILAYICGMEVLDEFSLMNIAVSEQYHNKGYGTMLIDYLVAQCIYKRFKVIFLEVRVSNEKAINLYNKTGFEIIGKRKGYYQNPPEDAYVMSLSL